MTTHRPDRWPLCNHAEGCNNWCEHEGHIYCTQHLRKGERRTHDHGGPLEWNRFKGQTGAGIEMQLPNPVRDQRTGTDRRGQR